MICAVVLAAGRSERMGTQKLLLPLGGKLVIARVVDELLQGPIDEILVVVGKDAEPLREALASRAVRFVRNPETLGDMLGSVRCGLRALPQACQAVLVVLGDQPAIRHSLVHDLIELFRRGKSRIVVPSCDGHRGHPILFSSQYFEEILKSHTNTGLRGFLDVHSNEVSSIAVMDSTALEDMDTPADYQRQEKLFAGRCAETVSPP